MRNLHVTIILILVLIQFSYGQKQPENQREIFSNDTTYVNHLNKLAWKYKNNDSIAREYAIKAKNISDSISFDKGLSTSFMRLGILERNKGNYEIAKSYYIRSLNVEININNAYGIARAKFQLAKIYQRLEDYDIALKYCNDAITECLKTNKEKFLASIYSTHSSICLDLNFFDQSLESQFESIRIREKIGDTKNLAKSYLNIGILFNRLRKKEKALPYLLKSKTLYEKLNNETYLAEVYIGLGINYVLQKKMDSALISYNKSLNIKNRLGIKNKEALFNNIGVVYEEKQQFDLAEEHYLKSISLAKKNKNELHLVDVYYNIGGLYRKQNFNLKALEYLKKSNELVKKHKNELIRLDILMTIAEAHEHLGDFKKASLYNEKHIVLRDSIDNKFRALEVLEDKYEDQKKINEINKEKNLRVVAENNKKTTQLYALTGGVILMALLFFALFYAYKSKKAKELAEKTKEIEVQKNIELLKKQELKSIKAMINGQEAERKRIAKDLHDRLGSMLSMVKLNYKSIEDSIDKLKEENKKQYSQANALLDEACNTVREIAHNMVSGVLTKFGLVAALEDLKNTIEGTNTFQLELVTHGLDNRLENNLEIELYGIVQELIHNVIKHAKANEVSVQLLKRVDGVNLTVIDDGIGFDNSKEESKSGMGLKSVASRVQELNGVFDIDTGKGNGTTIAVDIPL